MIDSPVHSSTAARDALLAVVCGGAIMGLALGVRHVEGLFLLPMTMDRGWSRQAFAFAIALQNLCWGLAQPISGMVADRFGAKRVVGAGALLYGLGLAAMATCTTPGGLILGAGMLIGVAQSCTTFAVVYGALSRLVAPARRSWALGTAGAIGGVGQFAMVPVAQAAMQRSGWPGALLLLGLAVALASVAAIGLDDAPSPARGPASASSPATAALSTIPSAESMTAAIREAFAHRGFWLLNAGFLACGFQLAFIASHLPAYLLDRGLDATAAVTGLALIALANIAGTYVFGWLGGLLRRKYLLAGLYLARTVVMALFLLVPVSPPSVDLFCAAMGFLWLGTVPLTNGLVSGVFGVRYVATLFGFVFFGHQLGAFLGVWLGGAVYDRTHSYDLVWLGAMSLGVVAAALHVFIDDRPVAAGRARIGSAAGAA